MRGGECFVKREVIIGKMKVIICGYQASLGSQYFERKMRVKVEIKLFRLRYP